MRRDLLAGGFFLLLGLILVAFLIPQGIVEPKKIKYAALAPSFYPGLVAIALIFIGGGVTLRALWLADSKRLVLSWNVGTRKIVVAIAVIGSTVVLLPWLGLPLGSAATLCALTLLGGERRPALVGLITLLVPAVLYLFFTKLAGIPIPAGVLEPLLRAV